MTFLLLIITNLRRHRVRTIIGASGIAFGVAMMLCVVTILQGAIGMFERILSSDSEVIVFEKNVSDLFFSSVPVKDIDQLQQSELVEHAEPALFGIVSSKEQPVITCFGIRSSSSRLQSAEWLSGSIENFKDDGDSIVLGERAADFLHATVGKPVTIGRESFNIAGIIRTENGFEDGGVFMPLKLSQKYFHKENLASVATIKLKNKADIDKFRKLVERDYPKLIALDNEEFSRTYSQFRILKTTAWVVGACSFLLGGLSVANTMILSVFGRIREIAILRVCGFSRKQVAILIFGESILVSFSGVAIGVLLSKIIMVILKNLPSLQGYIDTNIEWHVILIVVILSLLTGIAGAFYPALYAMKVKPVTALRYE